MCQITGNEREPMLDRGRGDDDVERAFMHLALLTTQVEADVRRTFEDALADVDNGHPDQEPTKTVFCQLTVSTAADSPHDLHICDGADRNTVRQEPLQ